MTLLDAPTYNAARANRNRNVIIGIIELILLVAVTGFLGFLTGHGWFFSTVPSEHRVNKFLEAVEANDFTKAYGLWNHDADWQKHPDQYKLYDFNQFQKDWGSGERLRGDPQPPDRHRKSGRERGGDGRQYQWRQDASLSPC